MRFIRLAFRLVLIFAVLIIGMAILRTYWKPTATKVWEELYRTVEHRHHPHARRREGLSQHDLISRYDLICFIAGEQQFLPSRWFKTPSCELKPGKAAIVGDEPNVARLALIKGDRKECMWTVAPYRIEADFCAPPSQLKLEAKFYFFSDEEQDRSLSELHPELLYVEVTPPAAF
jgi:hypothetical protein